MNVNDIRKKFLEFFKSKGHKIVASDSLVPKNDPTVLFTTAGMQQFKRQFLGQTDGFTTAATSQKCLRTDDLDEVGKTDFHHTLFEMLGNFSFGDYFKKEAIAWAWEFLTVVMGIDKNKLWVSVYKDDDEAKAIWLNDINVDKSKLVSLGDHSNFWPADAKEKGPNGPCGPCSEIFFDYGENPNCTSKTCDPACDCGRFSEIWNLVFTQFERKEDGTLDPLPNKNIDTGMGLERLTAVMQGKKNNYETDLFAPILKAIRENISDDEKLLTKTQRYIIADHIRAIVFGISDGVIPSNEGRGYVIKKLIIDITDIVLQTGRAVSAVYKLVPAVVEAMKTPYPEIDEKQKDIVAIIKNVEESYQRVRKERLPEFIDSIKNVKSPDALGQLIFKYRDTFGLALNTIEKTIASRALDQSLLQDSWKVYDDLMTEQQEKSRAGSKISSDVFAGRQLSLNVPKTQFMGYDHASSTSTIIGMFIDDQKVNEAQEGSQVTIVLDKTPFYAESGGQVGDSGTISKETGSIRIDDTQQLDDIFLHIGIIESGAFHTDDLVKAEIDFDKRMSIMRNHTATHLLQAALREVLGTHVMQQGSLVDADRFRFDFTHHKALETDEIKKIEQAVNQRIMICDSVTKDILTIEQAKKSGALAFFAEKYGETVRVVSISDYSKEFCGGTHCDFTGQIGFFKIVDESAIAQGIRRIEAKTGMGAVNYSLNQNDQLVDASKILKAPVHEIVDRLKIQTNKIKQFEKDLENLRFEAIKGSVDEIINKAEKSKNAAIITHVFDKVSINVLRRVTDLIRQKIKSAIIVLGARYEDNAAIVVAVSDDLIKKDFKANAIIQSIAPLINGSGGGRPQLAQAGSKETKNITSAIQQAVKIIKDQENL